MLRAAASFALVLLCVATAALMLPRADLWGYVPAGRGVSILLTIVLLPALVMWGGLEVLQLLRPRRVFIGVRRSTGLLLLWGGGAAMTSVALSAVGMAWLDRHVSDAIVLTAAALLATVLLFPLLPRQRRGRCVYCNYNQRGATVRSEGCCAECGRTAPTY